MRLRLRVKEEARAQGVSMTKLHIKSEVAYSTVRRLFRDPFAEVTTTTINRLANALGVPPSNLIEDAPDEEG
jgi:transcriptional regulator with XRE-family HTH domain